MTEPKIRFKRDDGSSFPDWEKKKLGNITVKIERKASEDSNAPVMMISQGNGFIYQSDKYSRENAGQSLKKYTLLRRGEFAYNHGASKAKPYGVTYVLQEEDEARVPFVYHTFEIVEGVKEYWHRALNTNQMDRQLKKLVSSGVRMDGLLNINYDTYMDVAINAPSLPEQQKIADFLSNVDEVIAASEEEVANLEQQKKAVMQKIFSQEVRFKKDDGSDFPDWSSRKLGTILCECKEYCEKDGTYEHVSLTKEGIVPKSERYDRDFLVTDDNKKYRVTHFDDICYNPANLKFGVICRNKYGDGIFSPIYITFEVNNSCLPSFIELLVTRRDFINGALKYQQGTVYERMAVSPEDLLSITVSIPSLPEQQLIADFLTSYDEAITAAKQELAKWKELKKGLLQQMFV